MRVTFVYEKNIIYDGVTDSAWVPSVGTYVDHEKNVFVVTSVSLDLEDYSATVILSKM